MKQGPKDKQKDDKYSAGQNNPRNEPEQHEVDESLNEQPLVNEEKQKKIVNEQTELSNDNDEATKKNEKTTSTDKNGDIGEKIPAMD